MNRKVVLLLVLPVGMLLLILSVLSCCQYTAADQLAPPEIKQASAQLVQGRWIWLIGKPDDSFLEFRSDSKSQSFSISSDSYKSMDWKSLPSGLDRSVNPSFSIHYTLEAIPEHGVNLQVKVLDAYKSIPQMAVFTNRMLSGIVQIAGVGGTTSGYPFKKTYELYIPKEQLQLGDNIVELRAIGCIYCSSSENQYLWWKWDYIGLSALSAPAEEPIQGSYIASGTSLNNMSFYYDEGAVRHLPYVLKWMGIAYSGNVMRTGCATDVKNACSAIGPYYETLRDYNTQAVSFHLHTGNIKLQMDGTLPNDAKDKLYNYVKNYGSLFQYYEIDNEPGLFNRSKAVNLAIAKWLNENIPILAPHLKTVAPGWAYAPSYEVKSCKNQLPNGKRQCGDPDGWESDPAQRKELENVTDLTNGHSYGSSFADSPGGSFVENLKTFGGVEDGLPKRMLNTEYGTSDSHMDAKQFGAVDRKSAVFDRIMRAHIGYADMFTHHAAFYPDYSLFETGFNLNNHNPATTRIYGNPSETDTRAGIMRRLNLAYATHGKPLEYRITNAEDLYDKLVYFRGVDTSSLKPLPGSQGTSDKILLNIVNFEKSVQKIAVQVTMPEQAVYEGERFGSGKSYEEARTYISGLQASPNLELIETLGPGEAVQYILTRSADVKPKAPTWVKAEPLLHHSIELNWLESEGAKGYDIWRSANSGGNYELIAANVQKTHYIDSSTLAGSAYKYQIRLPGTSEPSEAVETVATDYVLLDRKDWIASSSSGGKPQNAIDDNINSRWDTNAAQTYGQYYEVNMKSLLTINRIELQTEGSPNDYPRQYEVYVSNNSLTWTGPIASGLGSKVTEINFAPQKAKYVKIVQTGKSGSYWSIHELQIYGNEQ
ncbi:MULTISPECIES: discoidin domain-containing protein [unclassified Paenibacillus]|uniref:discoidin domain-containing protein n=1 Tax=unclassified Paenibacillus TaxID=185978 RepID=UPI0036440B57